MNSRWIVACLIAFAVGCGDFERGARIDPVTDEPGGGDMNNNNNNDMNGGDDPLSFATDVHPLLVTGCLSGCHVSGGSAASTGWVMSDDPDADYTETIPFIDETNPGGSRLLTKGAGQSHGGGGIYSNTSDEFLTILTWIEDGALP